MGFCRGARRMDDDDPRRAEASWDLGGAAQAARQPAPARADLDCGDRWNRDGTRLRLRAERQANGHPYPVRRVLLHDGAAPDGLVADQESAQRSRSSRRRFPRDLGRARHRRFGRRYRELLPDRRLGVTTTEDAVSPVRACSRLTSDHGLLVGKAA